MNKHLYKFYWDCRKQGEVEGIFIASEEEIKNAIGKEVSFGEILGKHSDIHGELEECDLEKIDVNFDVIKKLIPHLGTRWSGYCPLDYIECEDCGNRYCECDEE